ncbi:uncharacterized protein LOC124414243 [Diprion similis]|uniref:uncharacterized protein LOC124414243 n=1 Tax=Diprion similis TaxID=362088 RepID=UPI001EF92F2F|nr:uncharacterized protein LOC124414243 [Diprion similis]
MSMINHASLHNLKKEVDVIENGDNSPERRHIETGEGTGEWGQNNVSYCEEIIICDTLPDDIDNENCQISNEIECLDPLQIPTELEVPPMVLIEGNVPGTVKYVWSGHIYSREGDSQSFVCSNRQVNQCKGRVIVRNGHADEIEPHKHQRIMSKIFGAEIAKKSMLRRAQTEPSVSLRDIYDDAYKKTPGLSSIYNCDTMMRLMMKARYGMYSTDKPIRKLNFDIEWAKDWAEVVPGRVPKILCRICQEYIFSPTSTKMVRHLHTKLHTLNGKISNVTTKQKRSRQDDSDSTDNDEKSKRPKTADSLVLENDLVVVEPLQQKRKEDTKMVTQKILENKRQDDAARPFRYPVVKKQECDDRLTFAPDLVELPQQKRKEDLKNADRKTLQKKHQDDADHLSNNENLKKQEIVARLTFPKDFVEQPKQKRAESPRNVNEKILEKKRCNDTNDPINYKKLGRQQIVNHMAFAKDFLEEQQQKREENLKNVEKKILEKKWQDDTYYPMTYKQLGRQLVVNHMAFAKNFRERSREKPEENSKNGEQKILEKKRRNDAYNPINCENVRRHDIVNHMAFAKELADPPQQKREENPTNWDKKILQRLLEGDADRRVNYENLRTQEIVDHPTFTNELVEQLPQRREKNQKNVYQKILENKRQNNADEPINYENIRRQEIVDHPTFAKDLVDPPQQKHEENPKSVEKKISEKKQENDTDCWINDEKSRRQQKREESPKIQDQKNLRKKCQDVATCPNIYVKLRRQDIADYLAYKKKLTEQPQQEREEDPKEVKKEILDEEHPDEADHTKNDEQSKGPNINDSSVSEKNIIEPPQQTSQEDPENADEKLSIGSGMLQSVSRIRVKTENILEPTISEQVDPDQNISMESSTAQSMPQITIKTENISKPALSVQVFEPSTGQPSSGLEITLHMLGNGVWNFIDKKKTDRFGICSDLSYGENANVGFYKLNLDIYSYYTERGQKCLYPYIEIPFEVENAEQSLDFRIQSSPFAYNVCGNSKS